MIYFKIMGKRKKYNIDHFEKVVKLVNEDKMNKSDAIIEAGFKSRQSYYTALKTLGIEEVLTIRKFKYDDLVNSKPSIVSFI